MPSYSTLVTDIQNTAENDGTEFTTHIDYFINKAENRLVTQLDDYGLNTFTSVAVSANNPFVSLPSGTRIVRNFNILVSASVSAPAGSANSRISLLPRTQEYIYDFWPYVSASVGQPKYYAMRSNTAIYLAPTPTSTYDGEVLHVSRPATLTSAAPNNYFSDFCYDALFYACMIEASLYNKSFNTVPLWQGEFKVAIDGLRNQARRTRQDDMAVAASPAGAADPIIQGSS